MLPHGKYRNYITPEFKLQLFHEKHYLVIVAVSFNNDKPLKLIFTLLISKRFHVLDFLWTFNNLVSFTGSWLIHLFKGISFYVKTGSKLTSSGYLPRFISIICAGLFLYYM